MAAARKVSRANMSLFKLWTTDVGTFPVLFCAGVAAVAAAVNASHFLFQHPDVCFNKERRESTMHYDADEGANWRSRRFRFANYVRNPINQSRQYDPLFEKEINKDVKR